MTRKEQERKGKEIVERLNKGKVLTIWISLLFIISNNSTI